MACGNLMILVLDKMQMFDQEIAPSWPVAEQELNLVRGGRIDLASLGRRFRPPAPLARMFERADLLRVMTHRNVSLLPASFKGSSGAAILVGGMPDAKGNYTALISI
jgi:hypothetical protein